jgi:hypothetical protein
MQSYRTVDEARVGATDEGRAILEIEPGIVGVERYIVARCDERTLRTALARKPMLEIKRVIGTVVDLAAERLAAREAMLRDRVPGLEILRAAREDVSRYHRQCERMMEDEGNDGARPPRRPAADPKAVAAQYPIATAYLLAEAYRNASHDVKSGAGRRAMARIEAGEDAAVVIEAMEREWTEHATRTID